MNGHPSGLPPPLVRDFVKSCASRWERCGRLCERSHVVFLDPSTQNRAGLWKHIFVLRAYRTSAFDLRRQRAATPTVPARLGEARSMTKSLRLLSYFNPPYPSERHARLALDPHDRILVKPLLIGGADGVDLCFGVLAGFIEQDENVRVLSNDSATLPLPLPACLENRQPRGKTRCHFRGKKSPPCARRYGTTAFYRRSEEQFDLAHRAVAARASLGSGGQGRECVRGHSKQAEACSHRAHDGHATLVH